MGNLALVLLSFLLLAGFLALTEYEARRGVRVFASRRERLDKRIEHFEFILTHVDFPAFVRDELARVAARVGHDIAHFSLQAVRSVERLLTRLVRYFRARHGDTETPREQAREFVKTLSDFKDNLKQKDEESDIKG